MSAYLDSLQDSIDQLNAALEQTEVLFVQEEHHTVKSYAALPDRIAEGENVRVKPGHILNVLWQHNGEQKEAVGVEVLDKKGSSLFKKLVNVDDKFIEQWIPSNANRRGTQPPPTPYQPNASK